MFKSSKNGVSLYLALMIMTVLLALALGISAILLGQMKVMRGMENSVIAFYAADTGIERTLYEILLGAGIGSSFEETLENGPSYSAVIIAPGGNDCPLDVNYCVKSVGIYKETRRAIRISR